MRLLGQFKLYFFYDKISQVQKSTKSTKIKIHRHKIHQHKIY